MTTSMPFKGTDSAFQRSAKEMLLPPGVPATTHEWNKSVDKPGFHVYRAPSRR